MTTSPLVLVTNDDGADAPGIAALTDALLRTGARVAVIAPETNHTAGSRRISMERRLIVRKAGSHAYTCAGTPTDCIRVGLLSGLLPRPDLVVTGINLGANAGDDVYYSGTVAAAAEAVLLGVPALAISKDGNGDDIPFLGGHPSDFEGADLAAAFSMDMHGRGWDSDVVLNVNIPRTFAGEPKIVGCKAGHRNWAFARMTTLHQSETEVVFDPWGDPPAAVFAAGTDFEVLASGRATVTAINARKALCFDAGPTHDAINSRTSGGTRNMPVADR